MPFTFVNALVRKWIFAPIMCPLTSFFQLLSVNGCIITLTFLAVKRFRAVNNPLIHKANRSSAKKVCHVISIWMISIMFSSIQLFIYQCKPIKTTNKNNQNHCLCHESYSILGSSRYNTARFYAGYTIWIFLQTYLIPAIIISIMYSKVIIKLRERKEILNNCQNIDIRSQSFKITRMLLIVICTFLLNWLPIHLFHLYLAYNFYSNVSNIRPNVESSTHITKIFLLSHWLSMANSFIK